MRSAPETSIRKFPNVLLPDHAIKASTFGKTSTKVRDSPLVFHESGSAHLHLELLWVEAERRIDKAMIEFEPDQGLLNKAARIVGTARVLAVKS
jgi:hypothetical protein